MSDIDLDAIRNRADAATPGPWVATANGRVLGPPRPQSAYERDIAATAINGGDTEFIAHAREDVPALVAAVLERDERIAAMTTVMVLLTDTANDDLARLKREAAAQALDEAAQKWSWGEWANAPRCADRVEERIANGQWVGEWLRARSAAIRGEDQQ